MTTIVFMASTLYKNAKGVHDLNQLNLKKRISRKVYDALPKSILKKLINITCKSYHYPVTLMFHHILPLSEIDFYAQRFNHEFSEFVPFLVTPQKFEEIIVVLIKHGFTFVFEDEYKKVREKQVILSFDDGYTDNYVYAYPILSKYKIKASINLISNNIVEADDGEFLSVNRIIKMKDGNLIQFQAHTLSHPVLTQCSIEDCKKEIEDCRIEINKKIGIDASVFVYPCGQMNKEIYEYVHRNYSFAYGGGDPDVDYLFRIPRIEIDRSFDEKKLLSNMLFLLKYGDK